MLEWNNFRKPQRYMGNEWNVIKKSHDGRVRICLCYPNLYEIGMSNVGFRIIYSCLNSFKDVVCERSFMPDEDLYVYLREYKKKLFSLETKTALSDFEIVGFNFDYELNFTNFLAMLDASGIPLKSKERKDLIVLGGGVANPESLCEFVDIFFLGEFEEKAVSFVDIVRRYKNKEARLKALSEVEGFYVPSFYDVYRKGRKYVFEKKYKYAKLPINKVHVKDLDSSFSPVDWLTPYTSIAHDRAQIEIARGCPNKCFFCQARSVYFPYRERRPDRVLELADRIYKKSGYENISLLALSASNYSNIEGLIRDLADYCSERTIGLSLPSLRIEDVVDKLHKYLSRIKKVSATFAVEAATQRLRSAINKRIDTKKLMEAAKILRSLHSRHIKLYFMYGLPFEVDEDITAIKGFLEEIIRVSRLKVNVSVNVFIPKPFSHFENILMNSKEELERRRRLILNSIPKNRGIKASVALPYKSMLEAVISRAGRELSSLIYEAYMLGARFDADGERFNKHIWDEAFKRMGFDVNEYLSGETDNFPWSHIRVI